MATLRDFKKRFQKIFVSAKNDLPFLKSRETTTMRDFTIFFVTIAIAIVCVFASTTGYSKETKTIEV